MSSPKAVITLLCLFVACAFSLSTPHIAHNVHVHRRRALMPRNPEPVPVPVAEPVAVEPRSSLRRRCKPRASRSSAVVAAQPVNTSSKDDEPKTQAQQTTTKEDAKPATTEKPAEQPQTTKADQPKPTSPSSGGGSSGGHATVGILDGTNTGDATFYGTGLGSCGITNKDSDFIVAVSQDLFDNFPGYKGGNPNNNPVCNKKIKATIDGKSVTVTVTDRCVACKETDLDFSPAAFNSIADPARGRIPGMTWTWA